MRSRNKRGNIFVTLGVFAFLVMTCFFLRRLHHTVLQSDPKSLTSPRAVAKAAGKVQLANLNRLQELPRSFGGVGPLMTSPLILPGATTIPPGNTKGTLSLGLAAVDQPSASLAIATVSVSKPIAVTLAPTSVPRSQEMIASIGNATYISGENKSSPLILAATDVVPPLEQERFAAEGRLSSRPSVAGTGSTSDVQIAAGFEGCPQCEIRRISPTHFLLTLTSDNSQNWFMFRATGVAGKTVRIDIHGSHVLHWRTLNPVYSSVESLDDLDAFSSSPMIKGQNGLPAWHGPLLPDTSGQKWHYIQNVWMDNSSILSIVQHFDANRYYIAMRPPYTPSYNERFLAAVANGHGVHIHNLGVSPRGKPIRLVEIGDGDTRATPCVLIYAREHSNEQDSSWAAQGAINFLLADNSAAHAIRERTTFLIMPVLDPDGATAGAYERITKTFSADPSIESTAIGRFMLAWILAGKRLDLVLDLHNVESAEQPNHISCAYRENAEMFSADFEAFHEGIIKTLGNAGYIVSHRMPTATSCPQFRLGGWLSCQFGAMDMLLELNSQAPNRHLNISECRGIGEQLVGGSSTFLHSFPGSELQKKVNLCRSLTTQLWSALPTDEKALKSVDPFWLADQIGLPMAALNTKVDK